MKQAEPLVTVVALCYNHKRFLIETLESIRSQTYSNFEVIVMDDYSTDGSAELIESWLMNHAPDWKFLRHVQNRGVCKSLNESLDLAKGKYYKAIACDDILLPEFLSIMVERFEQLPEDYAVIYSDVTPIDQESAVFGKTPFTERDWDTDEKVPSGNLFDQLAGWCFIPAPGTFMRTNVLKEIRFDESLLIEDWDMWLQISKKYKIKGIASAMTQYRIHRNSVYQTKSPSYLDHELRVVRKHLGFSIVADKKIREFIYEKSLFLYMYGGQRQLFWLLQRFRTRMTISNFFHVLYALFGISFATKQKFKKICFPAR